MKKIYYYIVILFLGINSLCLAGGISQVHLVSMEPSIHASDVSPTVTPTFTFDRVIVRKSITKKSIMLQKITPPKHAIKGNSIVQSDKSLAFISSQPLEKGTYSIEVKPIQLQKEGTKEVKPKTAWQKFIAWLCGLVYDDISDCSLCKHFCDVDRYIKTKPIIYTFEVKDEAPSVIALDVNVTKIELSEHNSTSIKVTVRHDDNTTEDVTQKATYASNDNSVDIDKGVITSNAEGSATVTVSYGGKTTTIQVEVYEMIEGHLLPHAPQNPDATLLGVDDNNNSVRDDVERWIYKEMPTYHHPEIERVVAMTEAKAYQMVLVDPTNKDDKVHKAIRKASNCWSYYSDVRSLPFDDAIEKFSNRLLDKQFNTRTRLRTFMDYENIISSKLVLTPLVPLQLLNTSYCNQNIDVLP